MSSNNRVASTNNVSDNQNKTINLENNTHGVEENLLENNMNHIDEKYDKLESIVQLLLKRTESLLEKSSAGVGEVQSPEEDKISSVAHKQVIKTDQCLEIRTAFVKEVGSYSGGDTSDPKVKFAKWKDDVISFYFVYKDVLPNEDYMVKLISLRLRDNAKVWFDENVDKFKTYNDVIAGIEKQFGPPNHYWKFLDKVKSYNPAGKSMRQIGMDFGEMVKTAPKDVNPLVLASLFYQLIPSRLLGYVLAQKPHPESTWQTLFNVATMFDLPENRSKRKVGTLEGRGDQNSSIKKRKNKCFRCKKEGHFANQCSESRKHETKN